MVLSLVLFLFLNLIAISWFTAQSQKLGTQSRTPIWVAETLLFDPSLLLPRVWEPEIEPKPSDIRHGCLHCKAKHSLLQDLCSNLQVS